MIGSSGPKISSCMMRAALSETVDDLWRDMQWAIQRIKGESHNICELI